MREIARVQQGFFPTQDRIVQIISKLFRFPAANSGAFVVLDAGCGTGKAVHDLRNHWRAQAPTLNIGMLGIESNKERCQKAATLFARGKGCGTAIWSAI
ncbi:MAG TPA: hypothetical protein VKX17_08905 [Planctomycetota bacterium]|nr:hypothetical protein [Planctomycetota bacterium]